MHLNRVSLESSPSPSHVLQKLVERVADQIDPQDFTQWSSCLNAPLNLFFSDDAQSGHVRTAASLLCEGCPVRSLCASKALQEPAAHAFSTVGGVQVPFTEAAKRKAEARLAQVADNPQYQQQALQRQVTLALAALAASGYQPDAAWQGIAGWANLSVFREVCRLAGLPRPHARTLALVHRRKCETMEAVDAADQHQLSSPKE